MHINRHCCRLTIIVWIVLVSRKKQEPNKQWSWLTTSSDNLRHPNGRYAKGPSVDLTTNTPHISSSIYSVSKSAEKTKRKRQTLAQSPLDPFCYFFRPGILSVPVQGCVEPPAITRKRFFVKNHCIAPNNKFRPDAVPAGAASIPVF